MAPLLLALYSGYPPVGVPVETRRITRKVARSAEEAAEHKVKVGERYVADTKVVRKRFLPLALGRRDARTELVERREDGTIVEERTTTVEGRIKLGLDVAGGTELLYKLKPLRGETVVGKVADTIEILKKRIDPTNVKEYRIQALEHDRILIQIPQATPAEVERDKRRLEKMGRLEFKLAVPRSSDETKFLRLYQEAEGGQTPEGYTRRHVDGDPSKAFFLVKKGEAEITGEYLAASGVRRATDEFGQPAVGFEFDGIGTRRFAQITETNRGWLLGIVLDDVLRSAPRIDERILGPGIIKGNFTEEEVSDMLNILRSGSLPMDIELLQESTVGPQIGRDSIRRGLRALAIAGFLILVFIGVYYIRCGMVADAALVFNLILLVGVLSILGAALTLPGMAGILLTLGIAVDANVLIFERIREESAAGKGLRLALRNGYERAFTTIVDANVTTLLTAVILYLVGTGPVRGFAVTLSFGILLSMFTALVVTRLAFETMIEKQWMREFKMFSVIGKPQIGFSRIRKLAYVISVAVVAIGILALVGRGTELYDIDFTGGSLVHLSLSRPTGVGEVRSRLVEGGFPRAEVQGIRTARATEEGVTDFGVRIKGAGVQKVKETLLPLVQQRLLAAGMIEKADSVEAASDGRGLEVSLKEPAEEMDLRSALSEDVEGGDVYSLGEIGTVVADEEVRAKRVLVRLHSVPGFVQKRQLWDKVLRTLAWVGMEGRDYTIQECTLKSAESAEGQTSELLLVLDRPLQVELLATELDRREFPRIEPVSTGREGTAFALRAEGRVLEQFQKEFPAGATLHSVPVAEIDDLTITATLTKEFSEQDVRVQLEKQELPDVYVVLLGAPSSHFRLNLGYEPIRLEMGGLFADLAERAAGLSFQTTEEPVGPEGKALVKMALDQAMTFADVQHYVETAGIGPYAAELIVGREDYGPDMLVSEFTLSMPGEQAAEMQEKLRESFSEPRAVQKIVSIGSTVAKEMQGRAVLAVVFASVVIVLYVAVRFHAFRFGVAAIVALVHDVLITAGLLALADWSGVMGDVKFSLATLAAFMTILGYSLNDTIVVFDRIRENMVKMGRKVVDAELIDMSINQTLSRTILTSLTTLVVVVVLYLMGGAVLQGLALTLIIGVIVGTYSSMFIASPVLLDWAVLVRWTGGFFKILFLPVTLTFRLFGMLLGAGR